MAGEWITGNLGDIAATGKIDALASAVAQGVSANLCDALAGLNRLSENLHFCKYLLLRANL